MYNKMGNPLPQGLTLIHICVNVIKTQIMVYAIAGMMYAFAAALEVGRIGSASNTTGNGYEMDRCV